MNDYIRVCDVEKYYGNGSNVTKAIDRVSFQVAKGEFVGVMGASGALFFVEKIKNPWLVPRGTSSYVHLDNLREGKGIVRLPCASRTPHPK